MTAPLLFHGTLLNQQGNAINDAKIQVWQTDLDGNYLHSSAWATGPTKLPEHSSIVSKFQYFGTDTTDANGNFEFITYRPGIYSARPFSHFHFMVWLEEPAIVDGGEDPVPELVTQFYFRDETNSFPDALQLDVTEVDPGMSYKYGSYVNGTLVVDDNSGGDILLATSPTQQEGPFYPEVPFFSMDNDLTDNTDSNIMGTTPPTEGTEAPLIVSSTPGTTLPAHIYNVTTLVAPTAPTSKPPPNSLPTLPMELNNNGSTSPTTPPTSTSSLTSLPTLHTESNNDGSTSPTTSPTFKITATPGPTPQVQFGSNGTMPTTLTKPSSQPVQMTANSAACSSYVSKGFVVFCLFASNAVLRGCGL